MTKAKMFVNGLLGLVLVAVGINFAWAEQPTPTAVKIPTKFRYSVKFVCGQAPEPRPCKEIEYREGTDNVVKTI